MGFEARGKRAGNQIVAEYDKADRDWLLVGETGKTGNLAGKKQVSEAILRLECQLSRHGTIERSLNRSWSRG